MRSQEFDHLVRAAGSILGENEIIVIGSQAIHGSLAKSLPPEAERSIEVDFVPKNDRSAEKADLIDGSIGELSMFHETFDTTLKVLQRQRRYCQAVGENV